MSDAKEHSETWLRRPLCRSYAVGFLRTVFPLIRSAGRPQPQPVHWALGCLRDGNVELLGAWSGGSRSLVPPDAVLEDLGHRGVEWMRYFSGPAEPAVPSGPPRLQKLDFRLTLGYVEQASPAAARRRQAQVRCPGDVITSTNPDAACPGSSHSPGSPRSPGRLPASVKQLAVLGLSLAEQLQERLVHSVKRHGAFATRQAAMAFIADLLARVDRDVDLLVRLQGPKTVITVGSRAKQGLNASLKPGLSALSSSRRTLAS